jgi:hypothetical protein
MLKHPIALYGATQAHGWCVTDLYNVCCVVRNMTQLCMTQMFSFPAPKEKHLFILQLHAPGRKLVVQYASGTDGVAWQAFSRRRRHI